MKEYNSDNEPVYGIYIAGPLFNEAERAINQELCDAIEWQYGEQVRVFLPQRDAGVLDKRDDGPLRESRSSLLYLQDIAGLENADLIVARLEGEAWDPGTCFEIGYAVARGTPVIVLCHDSRWPRGSWNNMFRTCVHLKSIHEVLLTGFIETGCIVPPPKDIITHKDVLI
jgi:nucleoside 2-deoxyribosyltransferase